MLDAAENIFNPDDIMAQPEADGTAAIAAIDWIVVFIINRKSILLIDR